MTEKKPYYITTPIYYPNSNLHIGNTYTSIIADVLKRYKTLLGYDAYLVTGTDEVKRLWNLPTPTARSLKNL